MEITKDEAKAILEMMEICFNEGLLNEKGVDLARRVIKTFPELTSEVYVNPLALA